jgi:trehalose 6-phosphate synthase/phosphatase
LISVEVCFEMRLIIVSNRLPVTVTKVDGKLEFTNSVGGVATGLLTLLQSNEVKEYIWLGWPGIELAFSEREEANARLMALNSYPVYVPQKLMDKFYLGFCNRTIWPLFHYFPSLAHYFEGDWKAYEEVNRIFYNELMKIIKPGDVVWIHDYHFMLLPRMLRRQFPGLCIGFFLHIPFPSYDIFRLLPPEWRKQILNGLLGADMVGFHTHDYCMHFLRSVLRILGKENNMGEILLDGRLVKVDSFPMGIDYEKFSKSSGLPQVKDEIGRYRDTFKGMKVILSIDRLDYTKGILNRLRGYQKFLNANPEWHGKVVLVVVVVPSRIGIDRYDEMKRTIEEFISKINGKFGKMDWTPIIYQHKSFTQDALCALYASSDIALVTPLRDGMNLIAKEYIACRKDQTGVLILSEMAGAVQELGEAMIINPNRSQDISDAIKNALMQPVDEQKSRNASMQKRLERYDVKKWGEDFIGNLTATCRLREGICAKYLDAATQKEMIDAYRGARKRLLFLDYDGTLVHYAETPQMANPTQEVLNTLRKLTEDEKNSIILISGRDKDTLERWFGALHLTLVAEHGVWKRAPKGEWMLSRMLKKDWMPKIRQIFELYVDRLPGSMIEEKDFSIAWHYRAADFEQSAQRIKELMDDLVNFTANQDLQVLKGSKVIEVRNSGINKGTAALEWLSSPGWEFIFAVGDDNTDEDLFHVLPLSAYSVKIGIPGSQARFNIRNTDDVVRLLKELAAIK